MRQPSLKNRVHRPTLADLYEKDEVAWLERSARLIRAGRAAELDFVHLSEFLRDMAQAQKREVKSRLIQLIAHLLKWEHQPGKRTRSWHNSIIEQRRELELLFETKTLRKHAGEVLGQVYAKAVAQACAQTGLKAHEAPDHCPYTLDELFSFRIQR
ncbi:MAG: DUF29 domain-containing protein [Gemmataceae bacterium]